MMNREPKKYDRDLRFVLRTLLFAAIVVFGLKIMVEPILQPMMDSDDTRAEIEDFKKQIVPVSPRDLHQKINASAGKPLLVYVYASWCGVCRKNLPVVMEVLAARPELSTLFISMDTDPARLARYLRVNGFHDRFTPYMGRQSTQYELAEMLRLHGGEFDNGIPYFLLLNAEGKAVAQRTGFMGKDAFAQILDGGKAH